MSKRFVSGLCVALFCGSLIASGLPARADEPKGAALYRDNCAACHGERGAGTDAYASPLIGDLSVSELADYIAETMPEGSPEDVVGEDARAVAAYVHNAFYSPIAQARNAPARIELSRLTVRQHKNAVADLIASFGQPAHWGSDRGLKAEYFSTRRFRRSDSVIQRTDPIVDFDFKDKSPDEEQIEPEEFAIRWQGSVLAPKTGQYEFIVRCENAVRLWVNDNKTPLIDARVRSGDQTEHKATITLLGGRAYPLQLDMFKHTEKSASVRLEWTPPGAVATLIPEHLLVPVRVPETFVLDTPFPPDDRSMGYERGTAVSEEWSRATTQAALETAAFVEANLRRLAGGEDEAKIRQFCVQFAERALRRPLSDAEKRIYVDMQFEQAADLSEAVKRTVVLTLKSPRFLYLETGRGPLDDFAMAAWLSFGLWDSIPDQELRREASQGKLRTREELSRQASRMAFDHRAKAKTLEFLHRWLNVDEVHGLSKDAEAYPGFDEALAADLLTSLDLYLDEVLESEDADFRRLLDGDAFYMNERLAEFYGAEPAGSGFQRVDWEPQVRAGVLTHPYLLAGLSYRSVTSPIHRGVLLSRNVLGRMLKPPPEAVSPLPVDLHPDLTTRERTNLQTGSAECMRCHRMINSLGFALERFDAVGRYRTEEKGKAIDASGVYSDRDGGEVAFDGAKELVDFLAASEEVHAAFAERLFQHALKQPVRAFGDDFHSELCDNFRTADFNIRKLAAHAIAESAFRALEEHRTQTVGQSD